MCDVTPAAVETRLDCAYRAAEELGDRSLVEVLQISKRQSSPFIDREPI